MTLYDLEVTTNNGTWQVLTGFGMSNRSYCMGALHMADAFYGGLEYKYRVVRHSDKKVIAEGGGRKAPNVS